MGLIFQLANQSMKPPYGFRYLANQKDTPPPVNLVYRGTTLAIKDETKMLCVTFDHSLNFDKHVKIVTNAAKRKLACINKIIGND